MDTTMQPDDAISLIVAFQIAVIDGTKKQKQTKSEITLAKKLLKNLSPNISKQDIEKLLENII